MVAIEAMAQPTLTPNKDDGLTEAFDDMQVSGTANDSLPSGLKGSASPWEALETRYNGLQSFINASAEVEEQDDSFSDDSEIMQLGSTGMNSRDFIAARTFWDQARRGNVRGTSTVLWRIVACHPHEMFEYIIVRPIDVELGDGSRACLLAEGDTDIYNDWVPSRKYAPGTICTLTGPTPVWKDKRLAFRCGGCPPEIQRFNPDNPRSPTWDQVQAMSQFLDDEAVDNWN